MTEQNIFSRLELEPKLFRNKEVFEPSYVPEKLLFRENELRDIASKMIPVLRSSKPENIFLYGDSGSGKSATISYVANDLSRLEINGGKPYSMFIDDRSTTQYRIIAKLTNSLVPFEDRVPQSGRPLDEVYDKFSRAISGYNGPLMIVLDGLESLHVNVDIQVLVENIKATAEKSQKEDVAIVSVVDQALPERYLKTAFNEKDWSYLKFESYTSEQLKAIVQQRVKIGFNDGSIKSDAIDRCVDLSLKEGTGPKYAMELLKMAGDLATQSLSKNVKESHINDAHMKLETECMTELIDTLPTQSKLILSSVLGSMNGSKHTTTGEVYDKYKEFTEDLRTKGNNVDTVSERRMTDLISEMDSLGILNTRLISKGRYGRTKEIKLNVDKQYTRKMLDQYISQFQ